MRILIVHNHYGHYAMGGEALSMRAEADLLRAHGHEVHVYERTNSEISSLPLWGKARAFLRIPWSPDGYNAISEVIDSFKPHIMHVNNYKYLLSPSIFAAAKQKGVATVLTLHNYRLACPAGMFLRRGVVCEDCLDGFPYRMLWRRCTSQGVLKNLCQFYLYWGTRRRKLLTPWVDAYVALTEFARDRFIKGGLPAHKLYVKPNFLSDPTLCLAQEPSAEKRAIYVGRLSHEKGLRTLMQAWIGINYPLAVVGDGPERTMLRGIAPGSVFFSGPMAPSEVLKMISTSSFLVFPSACYESFGRSLIEAMALGKPVVGSDLGPRREIVRNGETGLLFAVGNPDDLRRKVLWLIDHPEDCERMGRRAREVYLQEYMPERNYQQLMSIYERAMTGNGRASHICSK